MSSKREYETQHGGNSPATPDRVHRLKKLWRPWFKAIGLCLLVGIAALALVRGGDAQQGKKGQKGGTPRTTSVVAAIVKTGDINVVLTGLGTVTPLKTVTVRSRVDGQLMRVLFTEGQMVKAGELLAEIDPRPFQVQLTQAQGQMARDEALLANAKIDLERYRTLLKQDSIAEQQVASQESLVRQYEGVVKIDQAQIDNARLQLTYARITAPIPGRLGLRQVDPGNIIQASAQNGLVVITQLQPIAALFTIPQDNLPMVLTRLQAGERIPVEAYDREQKRRLATGTLLTVDNQIDPATGTIRLKAQFGNEDGKLFPNQFVNIRMLVDTVRGATIVPGAAVQRGAKGTFVYVVKADNTVAMRPVRLGTTDGENIQVNSGISAGDRVVVEGTDRLRDGATVTIPDATSRAGSAGNEDAPRKKGGRKRTKGAE